MATINNTLFPGVVDTFMPAFLISGNGCRVYFALSDYNVASQIASVQVAVSSQKTNLSVLSSDLYPSQIKITELKVDNGRTTPDKYYFEITNSDINSIDAKILAGQNLEGVTINHNTYNAVIPDAGIATFYYSSEQSSWQFNGANISLADYGLSVSGTPENGDNFSVSSTGGFNINQYYKVQFRFTSTAAQPYDPETSPQALDTWLAANLRYFSEWSSICLIRGISDPTLLIDGFEELNATAASPAIWDSGLNRLVGKLTFATLDSGEIETDSLKSYQIKVYDNLNNLLADSGLLYGGEYENLNQFYYTFKYEFLDGITYHFTIDYTTQNLYQSTETYYFKISQDSSLEFEPTEFKAGINEYDGIIKLTLKDNTPFNNTIAFYRTSTESNFTVWEKVHEKTISTGSASLDYEWSDQAIESGVLYKYGVRAINKTNNQQSLMTKMQESIGAVFEYSYLIGDGKQLAISFNHQVSSMKHTYADSRTDTIGSRYPFIKRNGAMNYRTFPISGLISFLMDENQVFKTKADLFGDNLDLYEDFNSKNSITPYNDYIYEKKFRDAVIEFLHKDELKLFKSPTEGNILVRLMDISLSPEQTLGRYIWNFSCTAYEMDEVTIENLDKYNVQKVSE